MDQKWTKGDLVLVTEVISGGHYVAEVTAVVAEGEWVSDAEGIVLILSPSPGLSFHVRQKGGGLFVGHGQVLVERVDVAEG